MRSQDTIEEELAWFEEWPDADEIDADCETSFSEGGFMDGLRYALGEDVGDRDLPPAEAINTVVERVQDEYFDAEVHVDRHGIPPTHVWLTVRVTLPLDTLDEYEEAKATVNEIARVTAEEYDVEHISTSLDQRRD